MITRKSWVRGSYLNKGMKAGREPARYLGEEHPGWSASNGEKLGTLGGCREAGAPGAGRGLRQHKGRVGDEVGQPEAKRCRIS